MSILIDMWWVFLLTGITSWGLTAFLSRCALANKFLDIPNQRSSHEFPTPRLGGIAIGLSFYLFLVLWEFALPLPAASFWSLVGAGIVIFLVGLLDDYCPIPAHWRLIAHFSSAVWALIWLGGLPPLTLLGIIVDFGWFGHVIAAIYLVWLINLYNFMDGIDGLAGIEAITVCLGAVVLYTFSPTNIQYWIGPIFILTAAVFGFLFWNFPKARIFMGDTGSGLLGVFFGVLSIQAAWISSELFWAWTILLGTFIVDATVTLIWRILHKEKFYEAHRSHAYQLASQIYRSHVPISVTFGAINLLWLLPLAVLVSIKKLDGMTGMIIAYSPLTMVTIYIKRGMNSS